MSSFEQQLQAKRHQLKSTETILTNAAGERFLESKSPNTKEFQNVKLESKSFGFVVDTKPDREAACIIDDFLYLGSQDAVNTENIEKYRISYVLSIGVEMPKLSADDSKAQNILTSIKNLFLPCLDVPEFNLFENIIPMGIKFISDAADVGGRVLIHCNAGVSRSSTMCIAYLMHKKSLSLQSSYELVKSKRPCVQPNAGFMQQLKAFQVTLADGQ